MDLLTRLYRARMRLRVDPELIATVRWFWCAEGAELLDGEHAFGSAQWDTDSLIVPNAGLGELTTFVKVIKDDPPAGEVGRGTLTPRDWFTNGVPAGVVGPYPNGRCTVVYVAQGGSAAGGIRSPLVELFAAGGSAAGGQADAMLLRLQWAAGGTAAGGELLRVYPVPATAAGGTAAGGVVAGHFLRYATSAGGSAAGGAAVFPRQAPYLATGGSAAGGSLTRRVTGRFTAFGGFSFDGAATFRHDSGLLAAGGVLFDGAATFRKADPYLAQGGVLFDGSATMFRSDPLAVLGGVLLDGSATFKRQGPLTASGGVLIDGAAAFQLHPPITIVGFIAAAVPLAAGVLTYPCPAGAQAGDVVIVFVEESWAGAGPARIPTGFTLRSSLTRAANEWAAVAYKVCGASEPASYPTAAPGTSGAFASTYLIRGVLNPLPVVTGQKGGSGVSSAVAPDCGLASGPNMSLLAFFNNVAQSSGTPAGYSQDALLSFSGSYHRSFHRLINGPGSTGNQAVTIGTLATYAAFQVTIS